MTYQVPAKYVGKTLRDIRGESSLPWRSDLIANMMGIKEDTPLTSDMKITFTPQSGNAEHIFLQTDFTPYSATSSAGTAVIDAAKQEIEAETKFLEQYTKENPFIFDETTARQSVTAEYQPYYSELLQDYLKTTDLKRQTYQDEQKLLQTLKQYDIGQRTRAYEQAVAKAEEGFAGQGMFFSGIKQKALGQAEVEEKAKMGYLGEKYAGQERGIGRQLTGLGYEQDIKQRELERQQQEAVESGILGRKSEAMTQYYVPLEQSYYRRFARPGEAIKGYTIPSYYRV